MRPYRYVERVASSSTQFHHGQSNCTVLQESSQPRTLEAGPSSQGVSTLTRQGLEIVELLREAEKHGYSTDDVQVALSQGSSSPIDWLKTQWPHLVETVQVLATTQGKELNENSIGVLTAVEAKEALRATKGDVWNAVATAIQRRQQKVRNSWTKWILVGHVD